MTLSRQSDKPPGPFATRRTKYEIWAEVMEACVWEARTQTWLMRKIGLKTQVLKNALEFLVTAQLIQQIDAPKVGLYEFKTTEKGREALRKYYELVKQYFSK